MRCITSHCVDQIDQDGEYRTTGTGKMLAVGLSLSMSPMTASIMSAVPARRAGSGSATNDAGVGMASALGGRFLDAEGRAIADGGAALVDLDRIDVGAVLDAVRAVDVIGVTDV